VLFNSYVFIFAFLPLVLAGYALLRRASNLLWPVVWLVLASFVYYAWWRPEFLLLLLFSISVNFAFGTLIIDGALSRTQSRAVLTAGILFNLCLLGYFKYAGFFVANLDYVLGLDWAVPSIILPIGISFITFQKIAFLVDAHRGLVRHFTLLNYAFFVTFFPQLIAGPITHHSEIMPQIGPSVRRDLASDIAVGLSIFVVGLFKKVVVADGLAVYADAGYATVKAGHALDTASAWVTVLSYSFQLYYDFSGYSDMAVGLARMFGFRLPVNFYSPYKSASIIDFWRRWHITLSRFLRDYLYIPLGGSRGTDLQTYRNLVTVFVLCGAWHGANWTFVLWGVWHGSFLVLERLGLGSLLAPISVWLRWVYALLAVMGGWVLFRAADLPTALDYFASLVGRNGAGDISFDMHDALNERAIVTLMIGCALAVLPRWLPRLSTPVVLRAAADAGWTFALLIFSMITVASGAYSPFLYFKF
jgi:alginate O-acetyltransferase complex protein AlgI